MRQQHGPAKDSPEYATIIRLHKLGGSASIADLLPAMRTTYQSAPRFMRLVAEPLKAHGFVTQMDGGLALTAKGGKFAQEQTVRMVATKIEAPKSKIAQLCSMPSTLRPGALDYRDKPSIMGGQRVPFFANRDKEGK